MKLDNRPGRFDKAGSESLVKINLAVVVLVLAVLKLVGIIHWEWLWIFSPLWIPFALVAALTVIGVAGYLVLVLVWIVRDWWKK